LRIICNAKDDAVVHYAMGGIAANVFASRYLTVLPDPEALRRELRRRKSASARCTCLPGRK